MYLLAILFITLISYLIGSLVLINDSIESTNNTVNVFVKSVIGVLLIVSFYAIFKTQGNTILIGIPILYLVAWFNGSEKRKKISINWESYFYLLISQIVFYFIFKLIVFYSPISIPNDILFYGSISDYLSAYGVESNTMNIHDFNDVEIYHYFNEWLAALVSDIFDIPGSLSLAYVVYPFIYSLISVGVGSTILMFKPRWSNLRVITLVVLFFLVNQFWGGSSVPSMIEIQGISFRLASLFWTVNYIKLSMLIVLLLLALIMYENNNLNFAYFALLIMPFIWSTTLFGIFGGLILYSFFNAKNRDVNKSLIHQLIVAVIVFFVFYIFNARNAADSSETYSYFTSIRTFFHISDGLFIIPKIVISRIFYFSLFLLIFFVNWREFRELHRENEEKIYNYVFLISMILISAMMGNILFHFQLDSDQIFSNLIDNVILKLISFLVVLYTYDNIKTRIVILVFITLNVCQYNTNLKRMDTTLHESLSQALIDFVGTERATFAVNTIGMPHMSGYPKIAQKVYAPLTTIRTFNRFYFPQDLSVLDRAEYYEENIDERIFLSKLKNESLFYNFCAKNKSTSDYATLKLEFLKEYEIDYLIFENGSLDVGFFKRLQVQDMLVLKELDVSIAKINWQGYE